MPSLKYSCSGSLLMLVNGSTAIDGFCSSVVTALPATDGCISGAGVWVYSSPAITRPIARRPTKTSIQLDFPRGFPFEFAVDVARSLSAGRRGCGSSAPGFSFTLKTLTGLAIFLTCCSPSDSTSSSSLFRIES
jgi:hypothetical protein